MKSHLRSLALALCALFVIPGAGAAVTYNDLWWIPAESGWGVTISQQGRTLFLTFFVYGTDSKPTWFVATLDQTGTAASGLPIFTGKTYATTGPWYGGAFNSGLVTDREAGTASFTPSSATAAVLEYTVDGVTVRKTVQRQTLTADNLTGNYKVMMTQTQTCPGVPPVTEVIVDDVVIQHSAGQFSYVAGSPGDRCTLAGSWVQNGVVGSASGTLTCDDGLSGTFNIDGAITNAVGFTATYTATGRLGPLTCTLSGTVNGTRR
jgi:hypothetical protein